ncbi:MAG: hypothetical protein EOO42_21785 [Flavobacteriales bacterium]|nr:MAG: hypothetical protein EOO42_21785 [Flavobacteriales bacterium]
MTKNLINPQNFKSLTLILIALTISVIVSCRKSSRSGTVDDKAISQITKSELSVVANKLGLATIDKMSNSGEDVGFYSIKGRKVIINDIQVDLSKVNIAIEDTQSGYKLVLSVGTKQSTYVLQNSNKKAFKIINGNSIPVDQLLKDKKEETYFLIAMLVFSEIKTNPKSQNTDNVSYEYPTASQKSNFSFARFSDGPAVEAGCSRTVASIQTTNSGSIAGVNAATARFLKAHSDCSKVGGVDSGCLWGGYACVATQSIKCTGGGCQVPYGEFDTEFNQDSIAVPVDTTYEDPTPTPTPTI